MRFTVRAGWPASCRQHSYVQCKQASKHETSRKIPKRRQKAKGPRNTMGADRAAATQSGQVLGRAGGGATFAAAPAGAQRPAPLRKRGSAAIPKRQFARPRDAQAHACRQEGEGVGGRVMRRQWPASLTMRHLIKGSREKGLGCARERGALTNGSGGIKGNTV